MEKLSKGGKIQYILESMMYESQVQQMSSRELDQIKDFSDRLKQLKEIENKSAEELLDEKHIFNQIEQIVDTNE